MNTNANSRLTHVTGVVVRFSAELTLKIAPVTPNQLEAVGIAPPSISLDSLGAHRYLRAWKIKATANSPCQWRITPPPTPGGCQRLRGELLRLKLSLRSAEREKASHSVFRSSWALCCCCTSGFPHGAASLGLSTPSEKSQTKGCEGLLGPPSVGET